MPRRSLKDQYRFIRYIPPVIAKTGSTAIRAYRKGFIEELRNDNTRATYVGAVAHFCTWAQEQQLSLSDVTPEQTQQYFSQARSELSNSSTHVHLAAVRKLFDAFVAGEVVAANPATSVSLPRAAGATCPQPPLTPKSVKSLFESIDASKIIGLRDRALIAVLVYGFANISSVLALDVRDYCDAGRTRYLRFNSPDGKTNIVPAHRDLVHYLNAYLKAADTRPQAPLFRSLSVRSVAPNTNRMHRGDALRMIKRRAAEASLPTAVSCRMFRRVGISTYLAHGGRAEVVQAITGLSSLSATYSPACGPHTLNDIRRLAL